MANQDFFDEFENGTTENEDDVRLKLEEIQSALVWSTDWTTGTIVSQMNKNTIDLKPKFQRREAWDDSRKSKFIESIILGFPIPQIILAERKDKKGTYIVIDGKQRLLSIRQFFSTPNDGQFSMLKLKGLGTLSSLNGKSFYDIQNSTETQDYATQIENQTIRTIVIKNWPNDSFLYNVFLRLNTGSLPLSPQELRQALHPGKFIDFTDSFSETSEQIQSLLNIDKPDYRMRDVELIVRYFSFKLYIESYKGDLKKFFDESVLGLNQRWDTENESIIQTANQLNLAIDVCKSIWGRNVFRKWKAGSYQGRFNKAIFDVMVYYFSQENIRNAASSKFEIIEEKFRTLCSENIEFLNSFETSTKNLAPTKIRFQTWGRELQAILNIPVHLPIING